MTLIIRILSSGLTIEAAIAKLQELQRPWTIRAATDNNKREVIELSYDSDTYLTRDRVQKVVPRAKVEKLVRVALKPHEVNFFTKPQQTFLRPTSQPRRRR